TEQQQKSDVLVPELYWGGTLHGLHVGLGAFGSFGLPMRWENPSTFSGRHAAYLATIRSLDISPVIAFSITKNLSIGAGADWVHSKVQLEQVRGTSIPVAPGVILQRDIAVAKLKGDLADSSAWGWNAGLLWKDQDDRCRSRHHADVHTNSHRHPHGRYERACESSDHAPRCQRSDPTAVVAQRRACVQAERPVHHRLRGRSYRLVLVSGTRCHSARQC